MKKVELFEQEMHVMRGDVIYEIQPKEPCTVEELARTLAQDPAYQDYEQTLMLLGTCGEQIPIAYQKVAPIQEAYKDQMVKTAIAMVQPGETASIFYAFTLE